MFIVTVFLPGAMTEAKTFQFETLQHVAIHFDMSYHIVCNLCKGKYNSDAARYMTISKVELTKEERLERQRFRKRINAKAYREKIKHEISLFEARQKKKSLLK